MSSLTHIYDSIKGSLSSPRYTHWLIIPATGDFPRFAKPVDMSMWSKYGGMDKRIGELKGRGFDVLPISKKPPQGVALKGVTREEFPSL